MGTKTTDETGAVTGAEATTDKQKVNVTKVEQVTEADALPPGDDTLSDAVGTAPADAAPADVAAAEVEAVDEAGVEALDGDEVYSDDGYDYADAAHGDDQGEDRSVIIQGAGAVVSAGLGLVSLSGGWLGTVASARESLVGQLETSSDASVATQVKEVYGDAWQATAFWGGAFALVALIVGVVVLARPAFGAPGRPQLTWIKSVAWGGVALGVIGLLLAVLKYTDVLLGLPSTS